MEYVGNNYKSNLKNKRILIIVENLPLPFDRRVWQEANTLKDNGAKVFIICPKDKNYNSSYEKINDIHIYRHPLPIEGNNVLGYFLEYSAALFWETYLSFKIFLIHGFDIIHVCNPPDLIFLSALPFKILGKKFIFDHHDINPELYLAKFSKKDIFYKFMIVLERLTFKMANISIATNFSYKNVAIERGKMKPENVYVVRSGPKLKRIKLMKPDKRYKNGKNFLIGYVGVIGQQEGIDHLLYAFKNLIEVHNFLDFHCIICGSGPELPKMKDLTKKLKINDFVEFTGRIPDQELFKILNTTDICVNPDIWTEMNNKSTMNKIMEYMALKKPIVQYDLKEGRFSAKKASLYAKPNDIGDFAAKIYYLYKNPKKRKVMGEYGYNRVKNKLLWKYESPKLINCYNSLWI